MTKKRRSISVLLMLALSASGAYLLLNNLRENIIFFYPPSEIDIKKINKRIRVGGLVKINSLKKNLDGSYLFTITDNSNDIKISHRGPLPTLFRDNQGVVVEGKLSNIDLLISDRILIKHDENYKPNIQLNSS